MLAAIMHQTHASMVRTAVEAVQLLTSPALIPSFLMLVAVMDVQVDAGMVRACSKSSANAQLACIIPSLLKLVAVINVQELAGMAAQHGRSSAGAHCGGSSRLCALHNLAAAAGACAAAALCGAIASILGARIGQRMVTPNPLHVLMTVPTLPDASISRTCSGLTHSKSQADLRQTV